MVAAAAAPCGGTGRWGWEGRGAARGSSTSARALPRRRPRLAKKRLTQISVAVWHECTISPDDCRVGRVAGAAIRLYVISTRARGCSGFNRAVSHARVTLFFINNCFATNTNTLRLTIPVNYLTCCYLIIHSFTHSTQIHS